MSSFYLIASAVILLGAAALGRVLGRVYFKYRGDRVIACPENRRPAGVKVDVRHAMFSMPGSSPDLRLKSCSRWPERRDCGQECLRQIADAPEDCLVRNILTRWYEGKACALCGKSIGEIHWAERRPALLSPEGKTVQW